MHEAKWDLFKGNGSECLVETNLRREVARGEKLSVMQVGSDVSYAGKSSYM